MSWIINHTISIPQDSQVSMTSGTTSWYHIAAEWQSRALSSCNLGNRFRRVWQRLAVTTGGWRPGPYCEVGNLLLKSKYKIFWDYNIYIYIQCMYYVKYLIWILYIALYIIYISSIYHAYIYIYHLYIIYISSRYHLYIIYIYMYIYICIYIYNLAISEHLHWNSLPPAPSANVWAGRGNSWKGHGPDRA